MGSARQGGGSGVLRLPSLFSYDSLIEEVAQIVDGVGATAIDHGVIAWPP
jgi:hypothetical protein